MSAATAVEAETLTFTPRDASRFGRILSDALLFASTDAQRPTLHGVLVEVLDDGTVQLVATNSYVLAWIRDDEGFAPAEPRAHFANAADAPKPKPAEKRVRGPFPATIFERDGLVEIAKRLVKMKPETVEIMLEARGGGLTARGSGWSLRARAVDYEFPAWPALVPALDAEPEALPAPTINLEHFALLGKLTLGRRTRRGEQVALAYRTFGPLKPAAVTGSAEGVEFVGLIMPVRA